MENYVLRFICMFLKTKTNVGIKFNLYTKSKKKS